MTARSTSALLVGACALSLVVGTPVARADTTLDGLSTAIDNVRARSGCAPLAASPVLDSVTRDYVGAGLLRPQGYPGYTTPFIATGRPAASAIGLVTATAKYAILDCRFVDVGVGMVPNGEYTVLGIVLGSITGPQAAGGLPA
ncbi:hypothetical protein [Mycolicibacterium sediminis]|uniref:CAP domain-containing protein n=1 Tax=Mycolicibacterium sediminis TaxID=1286180 RepID=A0A7I7QNT5_9MYCO|nr:hypothetical protein [Mycolicibacterium sediminis]BBY28048.1 hypothetical protein MSEDJ_21440 [Mycolicibacterium sediminis]